MTEWINGSFFGVYMKIRNLPFLDGRYWVGMLMASLVGTTLGDVISTDLKFGFVRGLLPLGLILTAIFVTEWKTRLSTEAYYWAAIVFTRTMATNLADLATHSQKLDYAWLEVALFALLIATALIRRSETTPSIASREAAGRTPTSLPNNDVRYWLMIVIASTIGTTLGDFISDNLGLGVAWASILLALVFVGVFYFRSGIARFGRVGYWSILIVVRTTGTVMGDFLSGEDGLNLGFMASALCTTLLLVAVLRLWRSEDTMRIVGAPPSSSLLDREAERGSA